MGLSTRTQMACAWCAPAMATLVGLGLVIAGLIPPPTAHDTPRQVADFYGAHPNAIRAGAMIAFAGLGLLAPFVAVISIQMLRIEGRNPVLAFTQLIAGAAGWVFGLVPLLLIVVAAFRPDRDPVVLQAINDTAFILLLIPFAPAVVQNVAIAVAVLRDGADEPVFPRWFGYFNLWVAFLFLPAVLLGFFKTGPFAWHGLLVFYVPAGAVFGFWLVTFVVLRRAIAAEAQAEVEGEAAAAL